MRAEIFYLELIFTVFNSSIAGITVFSIKYYDNPNSTVSTQTQPKTKDSEIILSSLFELR